MNKLKKNLFKIATVVTLSLTAGHAQTKYQKVIVIMMDGFGEDYYRNSEMPNLNKIEKKGIYKVVPSLMPAVTNVNNISIATGTPPAVNGITGNVYFNESTGLEEYIESPDLVMAPTIFEKAKKLGIRSALFSSKKKTIDVMGTHADTRVTALQQQNGLKTWESHRLSIQKKYLTGYLRQQSRP